MRTFAIALIALSLAGCGTTRDWYIEKGKSLHVALPAVADVDFAQVKQHSDFVHVKMTFTNRSDAIIHFKPIDGTTTAWGFNLQPPQGATMKTRMRRDEIGMMLAPGAEVELSMQWFVQPDQPTNEWPWAITIDGLMSGDKELPQQRIEMPAFTEYRSPMQKGEGHPWSHQ